MIMLTVSTFWTCAMSETSCTVKAFGLLNNITNGYRAAYGLYMFAPVDVSDLLAEDSSRLQSS